jgi:hypothetical protein
VQVVGRCRMSALALARCARLFWCICLHKRTVPGQAFHQTVVHHAAIDVVCIHAIASSLLNNCNSHAFRELSILSCLSARAVGS